MTDLALERALDRVELVTGVGTREAGRMCAMSLVACLAGEEHSDAPFVASPLIRAFVIPLNDNMPYLQRQRLKPFTLRIIGTRDGHDHERAEYMRKMLSEKVVPMVTGETSLGTMVRKKAVPLWRMWAALGLQRMERETLWMMEKATALATGDASDRIVDLNRAIAATGSIARLLVRSAREQSDPKKAEAIWNLAIEILDELCTIGRKPISVTPQAMLTRLQEIRALRLNHEQTQDA